MSGWQLVGLLAVWPGGLILAAWLDARNARAKVIAQREADRDRAPFLAESQREVDALLPGTPPIAPPLPKREDAIRAALPPWCWLDETTQMVHNHRNYSITPREVYEINRGRR